jgi:uncharacterized membrane protein SirB2
MTSSLGAFGHLVHYAGFEIAIGASVSAQSMLNAARKHTAASRAGIEDSAASILAKLNLAGLFVALFGGILLIVQNPAVLKPAESGAGPWLHIKLLLVFILLVVAHLRMFRAKKLVRTRAGGGTEAECEVLTGKALMFGKIDFALTAAIFFVATFRFVLFA